MSTEEIEITIKSLFLDIEEEFQKFKDWDICEFKI